MSQYPSAIDAAEAELQQELREMFTVDTQQHLETYFTLIQQLNARSWTADIQHLYRAIHTIKGGAVTVAADAMLHAAIVLEDLLSDLRYLEAAPALGDGQLRSILVEAGELVSSSINISETGDLAIAQVQPTVARLEQLRSLVKQLYLPDWNELKQVHQEFAEQGFDLVTLELEIALTNLPDRGIVPAKAIEIARMTIDQLIQIGQDLELAQGWRLLLQNWEQLIDRPDCQVWQTVWPRYFELLKICVKNSGEISQTQLDDSIAFLPELSDLIQVESESEDIGDPSSKETNHQIGNLLDDFFGDESDPNLFELSATDLVGLEAENIIDSSSNDASNRPHNLLDDFFGDEENANLVELSATDLVGLEAENLTDSSSSDASDRITNLFDDFYCDEDEHQNNSRIVTPLLGDLIEPKVEDYVDPSSKETNYQIGNLLDNFFGDEENANLVELSATDLVGLEAENLTDSSSNDASDRITNLLDDFFVDEGEDLISDRPDDLDNLANIVSIEIPNEDEKIFRQSTDVDDEIDLLQNFSMVRLDDLSELAELDDTELIALIESGFIDENAPDIQQLPIPANLPQIPTQQIPQQPVETIKRGIQIPVPLERLDKSAQQVVDTLLTARAVMNGSDRLQSQLSQLTNLTQESYQFVTKLRQLQDNYAQLRTLSDEQEIAGNNVTLERYRQGYNTINRLLENMLRMSELGQEIETATYQSATQLNALDRSIVRLKDEIETSRLVPFRNMTLRAKAILRDLTNRYGKPAELLVNNEQIELDAGIVQQLEPALLHLLRNAYDHGLEPTPERLSAEKSAQGIIKIALNRRGNLYRLTIEDDGRGIDPHVINQLAKSKGFEIDRTSTPAELLAVLCQPGFSSSSSVSEVSGRGVGMDVVLAQISSIGGKLSLDTTIGLGTKFTIEIPAPQLLVPCVLFQVGDLTVAMPTDDILETALMSSMTAESVDEAAGLCTWLLKTNRGEIPAFDLANYWLPGNRSLPDTAICIRTRSADDTGEIWSIADDLLGQSELLINPLPSPLIAPVGLLGVSLQPDGSLISILDPLALTAEISTAPDDLSNYSLSTFAIEQAKSSIPTILIVDDAALMRRRFEASLNTHGFITHTCNDGLEALNWLQSHRSPDLMITDVEMPNIDGFTLIDRCRQANLDLPILVVSSRLSEEWGKEARRLGANDYLNKGFSTAELLHKVDLLLGLVTM